MHKITGHLKDGIKIGDVVHTEFEMKTLTGLEYLECLADSEKVVQVPQADLVDANNRPITKTELVPSPSMMTINVSRKRLCRIGTIETVTDAIYQMLTPDDAMRILDKSDELDMALAEAAQEAGRLSPPDE